MRLEFFERNEFERGGVGRFKIDRGGATVVERIFPARDADAPFVARLEPRKSPLWNRCDEIISIEYRKIEELARALNADGVLAGIFRAGPAKTVAIKSGHWFAAAALKLGPEDVCGHASFPG